MSFSYVIYLRQTLLLLHLQLDITDILGKNQHRKSSLLKTNFSYVWIIFYTSQLQSNTFSPFLFVSHPVSILYCTGNNTFFGFCSNFWDLWQSTNVMEKKCISMNKECILQNNGLRPYVIQSIQSCITLVFLQREVSMQYIFLKADTYVQSYIYFLSKAFAMECKI